MSTIIDGSAGITTNAGGSVNPSTTIDGINYSCRAWCKFNGATTGTNAPTAGGNVSTVTRNSAGNYTINFTTAMTDANYAVVWSSGGGVGQTETLSVSAATTSSVTVQNSRSGVGNVDSTAFSSIVIFR
jgi:hypothetical protein